MSINEIQAAVKEWTLKNFGPPVTPFHRPILGVVEEVGELAHGQLKGEQGIRGSKEENEAKMRDAIGDIMIYMMDLCNCHDWSLEGILQDTWEGVVQKRDWRTNPTDGVNQ